MKQDQEITISRGTKVTVGATIFLLASGVTAALWLAQAVIDGTRAWDELEDTIHDLRRDVQEISRDLSSRSHDRMTKTSHEQWIDLFQALNPSVNVPRTP